MGFFNQVFGGNAAVLYAIHDGGILEIPSTLFKIGYDAINVNLA